jgi:hypothetical protein
MKEYKDIEMMIVNQMTLQMIIERNFIKTLGDALTKVKKTFFNKQPVCRAALKSNVKMQRVLIFLKQLPF